MNPLIVDPSKSCITRFHTGVAYILLYAAQQGRHYYFLRTVALWSNTRYRKRTTLNGQQMLRPWWTRNPRMHLTRPRGWRWRRCGHHCPPNPCRQRSCWDLGLQACCKPAPCQHYPHSRKRTAQSATRTQTYIVLAKQLVQVLIWSVSVMWRTPSPGPLLICSYNINSRLW